MTKHQARIEEAYKKARQVCRADWCADAAGQALADLAAASLRFLTSQCSPVELRSGVPGKSYIAYTTGDRGGEVSRPGRSDLFLPDADTILDLWHAWMADDAQGDELASLMYTVALAPCFAMELFNRGNKKGPATYFEALIGHVFAKLLATNPSKRAALPVRGRSVDMTMDFLFDVSGKGKIHLPVKMSTRERVVQAWAHQRLLDSAYGEGTYRGIMVAFAETKLDSVSHEVIEICVPDQWLAYQTLLARMDRIYYFDIPSRYQTLTDEFSDSIQIRPFADVFTEIEAVLAAGAR